MKVSRPARSAEWMSSCAVLLAGAVGCVLVFAVALPLALSNPFPTPRQGEWVIRNPAFDAGLPFSSPATVLPAMEPLLPERSMLMSELVDPKARPEPVTFAERWIVTVPGAAAWAI